MRSVVFFDQGRVWYRSKGGAWRDLGFFRSDALLLEWCRFYHVELKYGPPPGASERKPGRKPWGKIGNPPLRGGESGRVTRRGGRGREGGGVPMPNVGSLALPEAGSSAGCQL